ncbi:TrkH family potassium uptake protein [Pontibacillus yanchengensis]|uniref:TrkH family potassium uptake protein n=2 Tax=Pontibacillus yanchengensis TaxID=462910 RepID=A0ACC7VE74_9BACI|nr:TrkH family potassium uptake protein [Pontibacillus yanchengensis]MYL34775.1 TrkH family potassium uptake protein [Pontibacillus yanchengensis]MYL52239.1 TrkH family potassium uptake protein [Pontibacillus yanchengensis]
MWIRHRSFRWLNDLSPVQIIVMFYASAVLLACILLGLPVSHQDGVEVSLVDLIFTSVSAVSVTGLTVLPTSETFSVTGVFLLALVLQFGGIGIMAIGTFIWIILGKKIGLRERRLIMTDQNQTTFQGMVRLMKQILFMIFSIELIGFLILGTYFMQFFDTWQEAYYQGFFASISATTNAGFDITGQSLIPFRHDYFVQFIHMVLIILGAIGFPVLIEVREYLFSTSEQRKFMRFSMFTKLTTSTYLILLIIGSVFIALLEFNHFFEDKSWHEILFYSLFQSVTTRSAGLSTMDVSQFTEQTQLLMSALMFIGASPSSVGGGIRTTSFALVVIFLLTYARGQQRIRIFRREVHEGDLIKAVVVSIMAVITFFTAVVILSITEPFGLNEIIFEVASAFGTTGLSLGITPELSLIGKFLLMALMFIGRIGILSFLFTFKKDKKSGNYHYPTERIIIG